MVIPIRDQNPTRRTPVLTLALIAANVFIFFFVQPQSWSVTTELDAARAQEEEFVFLYEHAMVPCELTQLEPVGINQLQTERCDAPTGPQPFPGKNLLFSVFASMFFHGGL
ncbi:MAG TPA: rhomboid family intramembrane serine protease, partial [Acidimicrobiia bacterium]|nr:rhomboid family intramembrane serine protease [Acidimicrobiia bacterium]